MRGKRLTPAAVIWGSLSRDNMEHKVEKLQDGLVGFYAFTFPDSDTTKQKFRQGGPIMLVSPAPGCEAWLEGV